MTWSWKGWTETQGRIKKALGGFYYVDTEGGLTECRAAGRFRKEGVKPLVGDYVCVEKSADGPTSLITSIQPRRNELARPLAANVDALLIVLSPRKPRSDLLLCDKLLAEARRREIEPLIAINKTDASPVESAEMAESYSEAARVFQVSAATGEGVAALEDALRGRTVCLTGQSAVGKSSLLNRIAGEAQQTGGLSRKTDRGRHTTRAVEIFDVPRLGLSLIDTPGFSVLAPPESGDRPLADLYPEFAPYRGKCRFDSCRHAQEPGCAVKAAVENGEIDQGRYKRYLELLEGEQL